MQRRELARYHDVAASTKARGEGIGFAGVGIKLGLLVSREVITETRRGATHVATRWHLASRHRAPWKWIPPPFLTTSRGTAVRLAVANQLSPLLDAGYLEETIRRHFEPLLDPAFDDLLRRHYRDGVGFEVDGRKLAGVAVPGSERVPISIRLGRRRTPSASGFIERNALLPTEREGIAISTFGKVIRRGWDWLGLAPVARAHISGLIEAPDLSACLTLSKNDFIRTGTRGASYLAYRKAIQEVVSRQLDRVGRRASTQKHGRAAPGWSGISSACSRISQTIFRCCGRWSIAAREGRSDCRCRAEVTNGSPAPLVRECARRPRILEARVAPCCPREAPTAKPREASLSPRPESPPGSPEEVPPSGDQALPEGGPLRAEDGPSPAQMATSAGTLDTVAGRRRPARYGLLVQFEARPADSELGRLVDSTIWINDAHPAYTRAVASRSLGYHTALAVALALAPLAVEARDEHTFITQFLAHWGSAQAANRVTGRRRGQGSIPISGHVR